MSKKKSQKSKQPSKPEIQMPETQDSNNQAASQATADQAAGTNTNEAQTITGADVGNVADILGAAPAIVPQDGTTTGAPAVVATNAQDSTSQAPAVVDQGTLAAGDVVSTVGTDPSPAATTVVDAGPGTITTDNVVDPAEFDNIIAQLKATGTPNQIALINAIENYMKNMRPRMPVKGDDGNKHQYTLWKTIQNLVETVPEEEFKKCWNILLLYFNKFKDGVFHDQYIFRFSEFWHHGMPELNAFQRIINVIKLTADSAERAVGLKQVSIERSLAEGWTEAARQRIINFYKK